MSDLKPGDRVKHLKRVYDLIVDLHAAIDINCEPTCTDLEHRQDLGHAVDFEREDACLREMVECIRALETETA